VLRVVRSGGSRRSNASCAAITVVLSSRGAPINLAKEQSMSRNPLSLTNLRVAFAAVAITVSGVALADDSSMSRWTGDSYAFFNNLDYSPGHFNTARAPNADYSMAVKSHDKEHGADQPIMLATRPSRITPRSPFRDDTGA
jgi:hypothetical protein